MQTWTDSFLENLNHLSQIIGMCFLLLALGAGYAVYSTQKEMARRTRQKEQAARTSDDLKTKRLEEAEKKLAEAQKAADAASAQVKQLQEKQHQRVITPAQKAAFIAATAKTKKGKIAVEIFLGGPECLEYATQIRDMLIAGGFDSGSQVEQSLSGLPLGKGLIVWARDGNKLPPYTAEVLNALVTIGLSLQTHSDPDNFRIPVDGLLITVGEAP
jgi:Flp pilus assembly protein TadB